MRVWPEGRSTAQFEDVGPTVPRDDLKTCVCVRESNRDSLVCADAAFRQFVSSVYTLSSIQE